MANATTRPRRARLKTVCDELYNTYHRREFVHPDPLEFLYLYDDPRDREIVGIVASSLAYGRVTQILRSVSLVLDRMGPSPFAYLIHATRASLRRSTSGFKHRFTDGADLAALLWGARCAIDEHGSLNACFTSAMSDDDDTVVPALTEFVAALRAHGDNRRSTHLLPSPSGGSACKRLNLYLRWMVRRDDVDPGGWTGVAASKLIVPLDTHMARVARDLGLTARKQADLRAAIEITDAFRAVAPDDPVRYDFALTRSGIRANAGLEPAVGNRA